ncbi:MAG TPA: cytochrome c [Gammaproteobacteria bacterium]|nr:cytochrome c [Gammaproteobacteria bacterium]
MLRPSTLVWAFAAVVAACSGPPATTPQGNVAPSAAPAPVPGTHPSWTGVTEPEEVIEARRALMDQAENLMKPIDSFTVGEPADANVLRANAATIGAMLHAVPHLFPPTTNRFDPGAHDPPTLALPAIWERFAAFETFAENAERMAEALETSEDGEPLREASQRLRAACDACHAGFMKPYTPPVVTQEDKEFDFDSVLPPQ